MSFQCRLALDYLLPRRKRLAVSLIGLASVAVISCVVWLVLLFLSITEGLEQTWIHKLTALHAPIRIEPTEAYYESYYYQIDGLSAASQYSFKSIKEKLQSKTLDPYDDSIDPELPFSFPPSEKKDLVKELVESIKECPQKVTSVLDYELSLGQVRLKLVRTRGSSDLLTESNLTYATYITAFKPDHPLLGSLLVTPSCEDLQNHLTAPLSQDKHTPSFSSALMQKRLHTFFKTVQVEQARFKSQELPHSFLPSQGHLFVKIDRDALKPTLLIPSKPDASCAQLCFTEKNATLIEKGKKKSIDFNCYTLLLEKPLTFKASLIDSSLKKAHDPQRVFFSLDGSVQETSLHGIASLQELEMVKSHFNTSEAIPSFALYHSQKRRIAMPALEGMTEPVLLPRSFKDNGVLLGDSGTLSYLKSAAGSIQEMRVPISVVGFYDAGLMPGRLVFASQDLLEQMRAGLATPDLSCTNGLQVWLKNNKEAPRLKKNLTEVLRKKKLDTYFKVLSFEEYDFAKDFITQLRSDRHLFTLIALVILLIACSNIISMLLLLVNQKKKEIGILQTLGASSKDIAKTFALCGLFIGIASGVIGSFLAWLTLHNIHHLVAFISKVQGYALFNTSIYGSILPTTLQTRALGFVLGATVLLSLLAALIPAVKASRIKPASILRGD